MNYNLLSPYIRIAMQSTFKQPFIMQTRIIFDYEIIFCDGGYVTFEVGSDRYLVEKNDIIFIRPGIEHRFIEAKHSDFVQPHVHFDMCYDNISEQLYIPYYALEDIPENDRYMIRKDIVDLPIPTMFRLKNPEYFRAQLFELIDLFTQKGPFYQLLVKRKMLDLLYLIFSEFDEGKIPVNSQSNLDILNVKNYIDGNFFQKITLDFLSKMFFINKFYLEENFKKQFGVPVIKYYNQVRFEHACRMLSEEKSVGYIAENLGFNNIYEFSKFFKKTSGLSPTEYKKN